ncbi:SRPBCC family protein [Salinibacterium sp. ZJ454]|uniref:SRPBCC family protein n=1 Tax=Salinibacterium sp. ZJ454 TaxID=2708339 RepID=UPI001424991B|nr:SRPBCC family protein [Salinibacterium sp. ZJ454]
MSGSSRGSAGRALALIAIPVIAAAAYVKYFRPKQVRWGSEDAEVSAVLPGDELVRQPKMTTTRAVTIRATPAEVWPWLVQMGYGRAGFYSYDQSEKIAGVDPARSRKILPEFQQLNVGDVIPWGENNEGIPVRMLEPNSVLSLGGTMDASTGKFVSATAARPERPIDVSWTFVLKPVGETSTRLLTRTRVAYDSPLIGAAVHAMLEPGQYMMERKMLLGIKERAEAHPVRSDATS